MVKFHPIHPTESTVSQPLSHLKSPVELNLGVLVAYAFVSRIAIRFVLVQMLPLSSAYNSRGFHGYEYHQHANKTCAVFREPCPPVALVYNTGDISVM